MNNKESLAMAETETSRHVYQPVEALAAYYTSPTFSQIHRESLTPNGNSAANQLTNTPVEPEFYIQHNWHDPFNAAATIWARAPGILQTSPGDGISDPRCLDSFPFSIHAAADGSFWENGYPHLLRSTPFLVDEGNSSVVPPSDRPPSISTGTTFTPQAQVIPTTVTGNQQQKMTVGFKTSQDRKPARRRMKKSKHVRKPYRKPSPAELARCETGRKSSALEVFYQRINELVDYKLETGDCNVPQKYEPNRALGVWVNKMRMEKKRYDDGKRSFLDETKISALESIGFTWAKLKGTTLWEQRYQELCRYRQEHGHCSVPTKYKIDATLGRWVSTQRKQYKDMKENKRSLMTEQRFEKLEAIGFCWEAQPRK